MDSSHRASLRLAAPHTRIVCLDIETAPDRDRMPAAWGAKFPKPLWHRVVAISVVEAQIVADRDGGERYAVTGCRSGGATDWDEARLLRAFWGYFAREPSRVVTWNGRAFDMPVLLQRTMVHGLTARGWHGSGGRREGYTNRFSDGWHCDLMDALSTYGACARLSLDEAARALDLPGKIGGHGGDVEAMTLAGEVERVRAYCEGDVLNLFGLYCRYALLTGLQTPAGHAASLDGLSAYLAGERASRPHLGAFLDAWRGPDGAVSDRAG